MRNAFQFLCCLCIGKGGLQEGTSNRCGCTIKKYYRRKVYDVVSYKIFASNIIELFFILY
jgi:hypothetical protein